MEFIAKFNIVLVCLGAVSSNVNMFPSSPWQIETYIVEPRHCPYSNAWCLDSIIIMYTSVATCVCLWSVASCRNIPYIRPRYVLYSLALYLPVVGHELTTVCQ